MRHFSSHQAAGRLAMSANPPRLVFSMLGLLLLRRLLLLLLLMSVLFCAQVSSHGSSDLEPWQNSDWAVSSIKTARDKISGARLSPTSGHQAALESRSMLAQGFKSRRRLHRTAPRTRRSRNQCSQTCTNEKNVTCHITRRSNMCIHKAESVTDFPNRPRNLGIQKTQVGDKVHFNITWKGPYDYSYKAVTGYEVHVSRFEVGYSSPLVDCYFMNLSTTNWSAVPSVHEVVYFVDCVWTWAASYRKVHVKVFSYPKVAGQHEVKATDAWIYPKRIELKNPSLDWNPSIVAVPDVNNRSLIVTVSPLHPDIAFLKLCISHVSRLPCEGKIFPVESPHNAFRYRVEDLATNASYYIYVQPFNSQGEELDIWIHKKNPIYIRPWPQGATEPTSTSTTSSSVSTTSQPPKPQVTKTGVGLEVVAVLVVVVVLLSMALVSGCFLYRKGYLQKIWLLRLCFPQTGFPGQHIKVLQLYVREETGIFHRLVKTHKDLLREHLDLECLDCEDLRHQKNMGLWLDQAYTTLVYLSPRLVYELLHSQDSRVRRETGLQNPLLAKKVDHIHRLASSASSRRKCWSRRRPPLIFILPDCWSTDLSEELGQLGAFKQVPRFHISSPQQPLLSALQGYRPTALTTYQPGSEASRDLSNTIRTLVLTIQGAQGQYYSGGCMNGLAGGDCDGSPLGESNGHACTGTVAGRLGHPHRTDSGFSSSAPDHHRGGSNSSSEPTSHRVENGEEENTETDPMIQEGMRLSVSQMSVVFLPPESVGGDEDSVVISNHFRKLNANCDWSS